MGILSTFPGGTSSATYIGVTSGSAQALTLSLPDFELVDGAVIRIKLHTATSANPTLNINGTGAKPTYIMNGQKVQAALAEGYWLTLVYSQNSDCYVLQGSDVCYADLQSLSSSVLYKSGGTMTGKLYAQANNAYTTYQVRNIALSTSAAVPTGLGSILGVYS